MKVALMPHAFAMPSYGTEGSAGADVYSAEDLTIFPGGRAIVKTGLRFEVTPGWELQVRSRSGLAAKNGVFVLNSPGTIDSDYRGELLIVLMNSGINAFVVERGMRIAQLVPARVEPVKWEFVQEEDLSPTDRGHGRFGSTGV